MSMTIPNHKSTRAADSSTQRKMIYFSNIQVYTIHWLINKTSCQINRQIWLLWQINCTNCISLRTLSTSKLFHHRYAPLVLLVNGGFCCLMCRISERSILGLLSLRGRHLADKSCAASKTRDLILYYVDRIALKFDRHLGSDAAEVPVTCQSDCQGPNPNLTGLETSRNLTVKRPVA